jgi:hypothetical protein
MSFEERKGSARNQLNGAKTAHAALVTKLMENAFKASDSDYKQFLRLLGGREERLSAMNDLEA